MAESTGLPNIRVVELGHIVAGPFAGMILADLGAEVIKVEHPAGGDSMRKPSSLGLFYSLNRGKKSVQLDLRNAEHLEVFLNLIRQADILIENMGPEVVDRLGIDYASLARLNPRLIYCSVKGFLPGPYGHRPLVDEMAQMMGGLAFMTGTTGKPVRAGASVVDMTAGTFAVIGALAALHRRNETGKGEHIVSGMFETVSLWVARYMLEYQMDGAAPVPLGSKGMGVRMRWEVYDRFTTADDRIMVIACTSDKQWAAFCRAFDLRDWQADPRLATKDDRMAAREWLLPAIQELVGRYQSAELEAILDRAGVPVAPVNSPADLVDDRHLEATGRLQRVEADGRVLSSPVVPFTSSAYSIARQARAPALGEHTSEILRRYAPRKLVPE
jgi:crotonobetainyl-CoA:carnitine CoA-transferase CaiB-like acyl-CoA transferase